MFVENLRIRKIANHKDGRRNPLHFYGGLLYRTVIQILGPKVYEAHS